MDKNLNALIAVVETGNLTAAADKIGLAQPSLTKRLKSLEEHYDTKLFVRRPHGMEPTEQGRTLYEYARRIQRQYLQAHEAVEAQKSGRLETIRIGAGPFFRSFFMRPLYLQLRQEYPDLKLEFRVDVHQRNLPYLMNGELDFVFGALTDVHSVDDVETFPITNIELGILAHNNHPLSKKSPAQIKELLNYPWIGYSEDPLSTRMVDGFFARHGLSPPIQTVKTTSFEFCLDMIATGDFLTPAATKLAQTYAKNGIQSITLPEPIDTYPIGVYVRKSSLQLEVIVRLIELLRDR